MSQLTLIADKILVSGSRILAFAMHLDFSYSFCQQHIPQWLQPNYLGFDSTRDFLAIAHMWLGREEGTGELPRTRDTLMKALQKMGLSEKTFKPMRKILTQE